ncbi:symplekin isoform X2 [Tanacetum coccineum]
MSSGGPRKHFKYTPSSSHSYEPGHKIDPTQKHPLITDMYFKILWDRYGELPYFEFIWLLIVELQVDREHGYFMHAHQTGFGEQYEELFQGSEGNLCGTWVGYDVLNDAITRVMLHWDDPSAWAWSCGVFALMFFEPCRFVWYHDKLGEIMTTKCNVRMLGRFYFLKVLLKKWREISIYARKKKTAHNEDLEAQPDSEKYTKTGAKNLEFYKRRAQDSLNVHLWQV